MTSLLKLRRARFGPNGIRQGSRRLSVERINVPMNIRLSDYLDIVDCGDVRKYTRRFVFKFQRSLFRHLAMVFVDNKVALRQLEVANAALLSRTSLRSDSYLASGKKSIAKDGKFHPRVLTIVSRKSYHRRAFMNVFIGW